LLLKIAENVKIKVERSSITTIIGVTDVEPEKKSMFG